MNGSSTFAAALAANTPSTGGHDFDFLLGTFQTHISYLRTTAGSSKWITLTGIVTNRKIWDGAGDLEEIEANGATGRFEGMTLRLYDAQTGRWSLYWANSNDGMLQSAITGDFQNGTGTFYDFETVRGRGVFVRQKYYGATPSTYRFEQAISADAGKTWQPNFVAALTRTSAVATNADPEPPPAQPAAQHDFDWQFGTWNIAMSRLLHPFSGSNERTQYNGTVDVEKIWNGRANFVKINAQGTSGVLHILALFLYLPKSNQWSMSFAHPGSGEIDGPLYGSFKDGRGEFYDQTFYNDKAILTRFTFSSHTTTSAREEEAFSEDGGQTWETVLINTRTLVGHLRQCRHA